MKATRFRKCTGSALYLAQDRTDIQRSVNSLASYLANPTEYSWRKLLRLGRYLIGTVDYGTFLKKVDPNIYREGTVELRGFPDTDFAGKEAKRKSTTCGVIRADGVNLATFVRRQDVITISSGESEFYGFGSVCLDSKLIRDMFLWFGFKVEWSVATDSSSAKGMALRQGVGKVRHMDTRALWVQQAVLKLGLKAKKVCGRDNPADIGTKAHSSEEHERLCHLVGVRRISEEWTSVPEVEVHALTRSSSATSPSSSLSSSLINNNNIRKEPASSVKAALVALCAALQLEMGEG